MGLPGGRKTKTGAWSTDVKVLDDLAAEGVPIARKIVEWRQLTKLKSTYTDALPGYIHPETGRIHTDYSLASTSTGRLSSSEPNLQNIPIRTEEGRAIRRAFIAEEGWKLRLRRLQPDRAARARPHRRDPAARASAFADGLDIHAMTASEMFGVPVEGMDPNGAPPRQGDQFRHHLRHLGLRPRPASSASRAARRRDYINRYFERFPGIRDYMDATKRFAREHLYVETLFGRRAHYPDIRSSQPIAARLPGARRDQRADPGLGRRHHPPRHDPHGRGARGGGPARAGCCCRCTTSWSSRCPTRRSTATIPVIRRVMENAAEPAVKLRVPLHVDARAADNWDEAH